jgi:hypothetical protein
MKTKRIWIVLLVTVSALLAISTWSAYGRANQPPRQVLYKVVSRGSLTSNASLEKSLNDLGSAGFELIAVDKDEYIFKMNY